MAKFTWQNGTLVSKAKVEINGTIYEVEPEEYSGATPLSAGNLNAMQDGIYEDINSIIETGSNTNGSYIKFNDGTMICYGFRTNTITNDRTQVGGMWYTNQIDLGSFPVSFVEMPTIILHNFGVLTILEHNDVTNQNIGTVYMGNGTKRTNVEQKTMFVAIGKWK